MVLETYVDVLLGLNVDKPFQYLCPPALIHRAVPGARALVPLRGRIMPGIIVATGTAAAVKRVLPLADIPEERPLIDGGLMALMGWVADYYLAPQGMVFRAAVPRGILRAPSPPARAARFHVAAIQGAAPSGKPLSPRQEALFAIIRESGGGPAGALIRRAGADHRTLRQLASRGLVRLSSGPEAEAGQPGVPAPSPPPTESQRLAAAALGGAIAASVFRRILLQGPPGSGKFETFLSALGEYLPAGRQALILAPEVALTMQLARRAGLVFPGGVAVYHGELPEGKQKEEWLRIRAGEARVVIGSRAAIFAPLPRPGVIYVAEEQETSYKSEETPRYHARDTAVARARIEGIPVVLSSSAPSLESLAAAGGEDAPRLTLPHLRHGPRKVRISAVDLRAEKEPREVILSGELRYALRHTLSLGGRSLLFVNRRGIATAAFCATCFYTPRCPRCSTVLSFHDEQGLMLCRLCGHRESLFTSCPRCGGAAVRPGSPGTGGVAREVKRLFPAARCGIMDRDAISRKGALERIIGEFNAGRIDVLVGTQILARSFDWLRVALVGVIDADTSLHRPDFRAAERTFQILTEVAGRAGDDRLAGRVIIQTHYPEHYAVQAVVRGEPDLFYRQEEALRREAGFPPYRCLVLLAVEEETGEEASSRSRLLKELLEEAAARAGEGAEVLGPHASPLSRRLSRHRRQLLLKGGTAESLRRLVAEGLSRVGPGRGRITVDVDPVNFL